MRNESPVQVPSLSRRSWTRPLAAAGFGFALMAAQAPPAASDPCQSITIGALLPEKAARDMAQRFVRETGVASGETPAARWTVPVCPAVVGLEDIGKRAADAKIRRVAATAGAKVAPEGCRRNTRVILTEAGASLASSVVDQEPWRLTGFSAKAKSEGLTGAIPIRWLYAVETRGRHGGAQTTSGNADESGP